jgi:hypothetical protein
MPQKKDEISPAVAMKLLRANVDDPKGRNPQTIVDGFDWSRFADLETRRYGPPAASTTVVEFAQRMKLSVSGATKILVAKVASGEMQTGKFNRVGKCGSPISFFWFTEDADAKKGK